MKHHIAVAILIQHAKHVTAHFVLQSAVLFAAVCRVVLDEEVAEIGLGQPLSVGLGRLLVDVDDLPYNAADLRLLLVAFPRFFGGSGRCRKSALQQHADKLPARTERPDHQPSGRSASAPSNHTAIGGSSAHAHNRTGDRLAGQRSRASCLWEAASSLRIRLHCVPSRSCCGLRCPPCRCRLALLSAGLRCTFNVTTLPRYSLQQLS